MVPVEAEIHHAAEDEDLDPAGQRHLRHLQQQG